MLKTFAVDLRDVAGKGAGSAAVARLKFCNVKPGSVGAGGAAAATKLHEGLGWDGLPMVGSWVQPGDALYCVVDELTGKVTVGKASSYYGCCCLLLSLHTDLLCPILSVEFSSSNTEQEHQLSMR